MPRPSLAHYRIQLVGVAQSFDHPISSYVRKLMLEKLAMAFWHIFILGCVKDWVQLKLRQIICVGCSTLSYIKININFSTLLIIGPCPLLCHEL